MLKIGCHLSVAKGFNKMLDDAVKIGANTFQFFTRNPRGVKAKDIDLKDIEVFIKNSANLNFGKIIAHAPYIMNLCSANKSTRNMSKELLSDDIFRMEHLPGNFYNLHPGSHVGQGIEKGIDMIAEALNDVIKKEQTTKILLETMAGKGSEIGGSFEELNEIIKKIRHDDKIGVCLDTCHIFDAGYDIVKNLDEVIKRFDTVIGLEKLCAIHINDSKNACGNKKDRHEKIGQGFIGLDTIKKIISHPKLSDLIFILETPNDLDGYAKEITLLKN